MQIQYGEERESKRGRERVSDSNANGHASIFIRASIQYGHIFEAKIKKKK